MGLFFQKYSIFNKILPIYADIPSKSHASFRLKTDYVVGRYSI